MIKSLSVWGLNGRKTPLIIPQFNEDLNLFTGKNGCGKTTILKILWYLQSGHFLDLITEICFTKVECTFVLDDSKNVTLSVDKASRLFFIDGTPFAIPAIDEGGQYAIQLNHPQMANWDSTLGTKSIFFPTFRRIEGGFGITALQRNGIDTLYSLSASLCSPSHYFVSFISTDDISNVVNSQYTQLSETANQEQQERYKTIEQMVKDGRSNEQVLSVLQKGERQREEVLKPFKVLTDLTKRFFQDKGISLRNMTLGDVSHAIASDKLSSGEKQMLSFLCYNTLSDHTTIYIDEPELSLHPDWQRMLIPSLLEQGNHNQLFMATHSPFIYAKYPNKEFCLDEDRGDCQ